MNLKEKIYKRCDELLAEDMPVDYHRLRIEMNWANPDSVKTLVNKWKREHAHIIKDGELIQQAKLHHEFEHVLHSTVHNVPHNIPKQEMACIAETPDEVKDGIRARARRLARKIFNKLRRK